MLIETLKKLEDSKLILRKLQIEFGEKLLMEFPYVCKINLKELLDKSDKELDFMISSCVKYKTGRIKIKQLVYDSKGKKMKREDSYEREVLVLTRNPYGIRGEHLSYPHASWNDLKTLETNFDIGFKERYNDQKKIIQMSSFLDNPAINQNRFISFVEFLKKYQKVRLDGKIEGFKSNSRYNRDLKNGEIILDCEYLGFGFGFGGKNQYSDLEWDKIQRFWDGDSYERAYGSQERVDQMKNFKDDWGDRHQNFKKIIKNWPRLHEELIKAEQEKKILCDVLSSQLSEMLEFDKPFRILMKLTK